MLNFIGSMILGIILGSLVFNVSRRFDEALKMSATKALSAGIGIMIINILVPKLPAVLAVLLGLVMFAAMGYLIWWWIQEGSTVREMIIFIIADTLLSFTTLAAIVRLRDLFYIRWLNAFIESLPIIVVVMSAGFFIANMIWFREKLKEGVKV